MDWFFDPYFHILMNSARRMRSPRKVYQNFIFSIEDDGFDMLYIPILLGHGW